MKPIVITWPSVASTETVIASSQSVTNGIPLTLNATNYIPNLSASGNGENVPGNLVPPYSTSPLFGIIPNLGTGGTSPVYQMPKGNVRSISIATASGSLGTTQFAVVGLDQNGNSITVTGTPSTVEAYFFQTIISITPQATLSSGNNVHVGLGTGGTTSLIALDIWNKNNNYTISYTSGTGVIQLTPYFTVNSAYTYVDNVQVPIQTFAQNPQLYYILPVGNANFINSPSTATTLPFSTISSGVSYSVVGLPMTGLLTSVSIASTASFTQTIIQQGGLV